MYRSTAYKMQLRKEGTMQTAFNDSAILKQVQASHTPHGREFVVDPVLNITEKILIQAIACSTGEFHGKEDRPETSKKAAGLAELDTHHSLIIQKLSRELSSCKWSGEGAHAHAHRKTMELLNTLSSYPWHSKMVLVLSGFAVNFGEFWLFVHPCPADTLSESLAVLRKLPNIGDKSSPLKRQFDRLNKLVKASLDVTKCITEVWNLPFYYIFEYAPAISVASALIPNAVYWTIKSIVTCSSQIAGIISLRNEYNSSSAEAWELSTLASKVNSIHQQLMNQLDICYQYIEQKIIHQCLTFSDEDNLQTDVNGSNETRVNMGTQRRKHMLLLISDLNISEEEIQVLDSLYKDQAMKSEGLYEMIWVPVVDRSSWNYSNQRKFKKLKSMMPWYSFHHPLNDPTLIKQIKEEWNFTNRLIVVVQDPQGRVSSINAIDMMWIWGNLAFPFTREREEDLWNAQISILETIIGHIDPPILEWMTKDRYICLYGGGNLEWIRTFTKTMTSVASAANMTLKMVYVGKRTKEEMQTMITTIAEEKLSYFWPNYKSFWFFWARLESILYSKLKHNKTVENDRAMKCITSLLLFASYDYNNEGWAIFIRGGEVIGYSGTTILKSLMEFENWKGIVNQDGFVIALGKYLQIYLTSEVNHHFGTPHSYQLTFPETIGNLFNLAFCQKCFCSMKKYVVCSCNVA